MSREDALRALESTDWSDAQVDDDRRPVSVVHSVRLPAEMSVRLEAEARRRGVTPGALIRELVDVGLHPAIGDAVITVRVADLHRAIDTVVQRAA
jgi:predicted DNA-binding protein